MPRLTIQQAFTQALQHHQQGQLRQAEQLYRQILTQQPQHAQAMHYLGVIAHQQKRYDLAVELISQAVQLKPDYPDAHTDLGTTLKEHGRLDAAVASYRHALRLQPNHAIALNNLASALKERGQLDEAIAIYRQAVAQKPNQPETYSNFANALKEKGLLDEAIIIYRQAIARQADSAASHMNLGDALKDNGQIGEAIAAYRRAVHLNPRSAAAWCNLGSLLHSTGELDQTIAAYRQAISLKPDLVEAHNNLGNACKDAGRLDEAIAAYRDAIARKPGNAAAYSNLFHTLNFHPAFDPAEMAQEFQAWNRECVEPLQRAVRPRDAHMNDRSPGRRLRIGYVSPDFRAHAQSLFMIPLLSAHDKEQVEIFCYSAVERPDELTGRLKGYADRWIDIKGKSDEAVASLIRQDGIDILVDLTMHMAGNRLLVFARRPAPVQVCWLAYPGSTGLHAIDYRLSDPYLDPLGTDETIYSEKTIRLPHSFWCYDPIEGREIPVNPLPALAGGTITFGCLNNFSKINDTILMIWAHVLREVAGSRLLLLAYEGSHRQRVVEQFGKQGIDPARIEFVSHRPRREYLALYHRIDISLDSFPCTGHTTSLDSFWMGVPVVTLVGSTALARAGLCELSNLGLPELVAQAPEQFVKIAVQLATDLPRLIDLRATLRRRMEQSALMDAPRFARGVESAYRWMWTAYCAAAAG